MPPPPADEETGHRSSPSLQATSPDVLGPSGSQHSAPGAPLLRANSTEGGGLSFFALMDEWVTALSSTHPRGFIHLAHTG